MPGLQQSVQMGQQQVLSPQMRQSLDILQATTLELEQLVRTELESNPVLEEEPVAEEVPPEDEEAQQADDEAESADVDAWEDDWHSFSGEGAQTVDPEAEARRQHFLEGVAPAETLAEHLGHQAGRLSLDAVQRRVLGLLVGNLDDNGYLVASLEEVADEAGVETEEVAEVLQILQALEPAGVGARNLAECLRLQLERAGLGASVAARVVDGHLDLLGRKKFGDIASALRVSVGDVREVGAIIAQLNPKPGRVFAGEAAAASVPDVVIERNGDGYAVSLARDNAPRLRISRAYRDMLGESGGTPEVRAYLREKIRGGKFFMRCIQQRQETILAIAREIAARQKAFLEEGVQALAPMTMAQVAEAVGVHETTVSRAIAGKTVATPQGVFEMRFFFTTGYRADDGTQVSNTSVKDAIAALVRAEDGAHPLSDQQIVERLKASGLVVARRTVAKYREALGFLPSHLRKSF